MAYIPLAINISDFEEIIVIISITHLIDIMCIICASALPRDEVSRVLLYAIMASLVLGA